MMNYGDMMMLMLMNVSRRMTLTIVSSKAVLLLLMRLLLMRLATTSAGPEARVGGCLKPAERHVSTRERRAAREVRMELWQVRRRSFREDVQDEWLVRVMA